MSQRVNCVCVDTSPHSRNAFDWYVEHFHREGDIVGLIHIHQMPQLPSLGLMAGSIPITDDYRSSIKKSIEESKALLDNYIQVCDEKKMKYKVIRTESHHSAGQLICDLTKENNGSSIILGQRGLSTFSRALLGSTSDYVLHHAHVPVVVVPPRE